MPYYIRHCRLPRCKYLSEICRTQRNTRIAQGNNPQAEVLNAQGNVLSDKGEYDKAIEKYNAAIAIIKNPLYIANKTNTEKKYEEQKAELLAKQKAELEAKQKAELLAKQKAELEAKKQAELLAKQKAELEAKKQAEQEIQQLNKLLSAIQNNKLEDAEKLIQDSNIQTLSKNIDNDGNTILHLVAQKNIPELYESLISKAPGLVDTVNNEGKTALEILTTIQQEKQQAKEIMTQQQKIIQETMELVAIGNDRITEGNDKGILILGKTGAGKSTLAYYLAKEELTAVEDKKGTLRLEPVNNKNGIIVNHSMDSETKIPNKLIDKNGTIIWDCPGFQDTGGIAQEIANAFYIQRLFETSKQLKFILAIPDTVLEDKFDIILPIIDQFSRTFTNIEPLKNSLSLIVTKAATNKKVGHLQETLKEISQHYKLTNPKIYEILEILQKSVYPFVQPSNKGDIPNSDLLELINNNDTEYVDLSIYRNLANIVISEKSREYANKLLKVTYTNIKKLVNIFKEAISDPNKCMTNIDDNEFIKSYDIVESLPKSSTSEKNSSFDNLPLHGSLDPFLKLDQIKSLQKELFKNLSNNNSNSTQDIFQNVLKVFAEFIDIDLKQKIQDYSYVFKQQIDINKCFSQVCGNKPVDYTFMEQALQECKEKIGEVLKREIKLLEVEEGKINAESGEPDIEYYKKAIDYLDPYKSEDGIKQKQAIAYKNLGEIYSKQNNYKDAVLNYAKALELEKEQKDVVEKLGNILFNNKHYEAAIMCFEIIRDSTKVKNCFKELIKLNPSDPSIIVNKGNYYISIGEYHPAIKCYNNAFSLSREDNFKLEVDVLIDSLITQKNEIKQKFLDLRKEKKLCYYDKFCVEEIYKAINKTEEPEHNQPVEHNNLAYIACNGVHNPEVNINGDVQHNSLRY